MASGVIRSLEKWSIARADLVITVNVACKRIFSARSCRAGEDWRGDELPGWRDFPFRAARSYPVRTARPAVCASCITGRWWNGMAWTWPSMRWRGFRRRFQRWNCGFTDAARPISNGSWRKCATWAWATMFVIWDQRALEELVHEIEGCDVGIIPNHRNTFTEINTPTRIFEYLALGKPVIAPRTPGIQDYFSHDSLLFFESGNSKELAEKIEYAAFHATEATAIAERGQQVYLVHSWQREKETLVSLVAGLIEKASRTERQGTLASVLRPEDVGALHDLALTT